MKSIVREKLKPTLEVVMKPISDNLDDLLTSKPIVLLRSLLFQPSRILTMRLDGLEKISDIPSKGEYHVRTFHKGDEDIWVKLMKRSFGSYFPADIDEIVKSKDFDPKDFFFLTHNNQIIGTVYAKRLNQGLLKTGYIHALCVLPEYRRKKLGRFLLFYALKHLRSLGLTSAILIVDESNEIAIKFYSSVGFKLVDQTFSLPFLD